MKNSYGSVVTIIVVSLCVFIGLGMYGYPQYNVWQQGLSGKAKLAEAEYSRQVAVCEAKAKLESSSLWGDAEIIKATAMAKSNAILATSLKNNHEYLVYLWIEGLKETKDKIIYVPTEAGLPVLESTRFLEQIQRTQLQD